MSFITITTGNLQSPRQSKFKEDFSPEEPIVADEELDPVNGFVAGPPYHLLGADGPRPSTEDAGFIRRHKHNLSNISTISNASTVSDISSGSDISSPSNPTSDIRERIISWYGPTQARERRCSSAASSIYSADSAPSSPVDPAPSWPLPNPAANKRESTVFSTGRLLLVRDESRPLSVSSYASRHRRFASSTTSLASRNSEISLPESPLYLAPPSPLSPYEPPSHLAPRSPLSPYESPSHLAPRSPLSPCEPPVYLEPKSPPFPPRRSSMRRSIGRPISQASLASQTSQTSQVSQISSVFEEDLPPPPRRLFGHRKNSSLSSLSSIKRLVPLYEDRVQDTSRPSSMKAAMGFSRQTAPARPPRPEQGLDFPFHRMSDPSQARRWSVCKDRRRRNPHLSR